MCADCRLKLPYECWLYVIVQPMKRYPALIWWYGRAGKRSLFVAFRINLVVHSWEGTSKEHIRNRRSKRSRKTAASDSVTLNVSGSTSVYQLKLMIWQSFGVRNGKAH